MHYTRNPYLQVSILIFCLFIIACHHADKPKDKQIVADPKEMNNTASENIRAVLEFALSNQGKVDDSIRLNLTAIVDTFYASVDYEPVWSNKETWQPLADTLF